MYANVCICLNMCVYVYVCISLYMCVKRVADEGGDVTRAADWWGRCDMCGRLVGLRCDTCGRMGG